MKKKIVYIGVIIFIIIVILFASGYATKLYKYQTTYEYVFEYGKELTIEDIIGEDVNINEYSYLKEYTYKKAKTKTLGSTARKTIKIDNNEIIVIGNRNLIKINDNLYVYYNND